VIAIHAGAAPDTSVVVEQEARCRAALLESLRAGQAALEDGGDAVAAVQAAVMAMEDFELFNAGRGAVLCADGSVELSAAVMRSDRRAGAVAAVKHTKYPIAGALAVMDTDQVLMVGPAADALASEAGAAQVEPDYFITARQRERLSAMLAGPEHATVGAVCLDGDGTLAAGTSTGGIRAQPPGRVGDCPLIGAGTWADGRVAVSCTGDGEAFIRSGVARYIAALVEHGVTIEEATDRALREVRAVGGDGGLVAVDAGGRVALRFGTPVMPRGLWRAGADPVAWVSEPA
jgi:beta-aspartyl-peptidase (threonine type)